MLFRSVSSHQSDLDRDVNEPCYKAASTRPGCCRVWEETHCVLLPPRQAECATLRGFFLSPSRSSSVSCLCAVQFRSPHSCMHHKHANNLLLVKEVTRVQDRTHVASSYADHKPRCAMQNLLTCIQFVLLIALVSLGGAVKSRLRH